MKKLILLTITLLALLSSCTTDRAAKNAVINQIVANNLNLEHFNWATDSVASYDSISHDNIELQNKLNKLN